MSLIYKNITGNTAVTLLDLKSTKRSYFKVK
jgi:hypothetical protein